MKELIALAIDGKDIPVPKTLPQPDTGMAAKVIGNALEIFIIAGIAISVAMIVWGGIQWAYSGGEKEKIAAARAKLTWAIVGVVIMLLAFGIISLFGGLFGINLLDLSKI
jgi:hypothetical protein